MYVEEIVEVFENAGFEVEEFDYDMWLFNATITDRNGEEYDFGTCELETAQSAEIEDPTGDSAEDIVCKAIIRTINKTCEKINETTPQTFADALQQVNKILS